MALKSRKLKLNNKKILNLKNIKVDINSRACLAEFIGTFALVFFGSLAIAYANGALLQIAFAHGLVIAVMVYSFGHVSGAHFNPAVTIPMIYRKQIDTQNGIAYIFSQLAAGVVAAIAHALILPSSITSNNLGSNLPGVGISDATVLIVEIILTFFLVLVIFNTAVNKKATAGWHGFAIGMIIVIDILAGGPITGASMNPARSFGPAIISYIYGVEGALQSHHLYWIAPIIGGLIASVTAKIINED